MQTTFLHIYNLYFYNRLKLPVIFVYVVAPGVTVVVAPLVAGTIIPATLPTSSTCWDFAVPTRG